MVNSFVRYKINWRALVRTHQCANTCNTLKTRNIGRMTLLYAVHDDGGVFMVRTYLYISLQRSYAPYSRMGSIALMLCSNRSRTVTTKIEPDAHILYYIMKIPTVLHNEDTRTHFVPPCLLHRVAWNLINRLLLVSPEDVGHGDEGGDDRMTTNFPTLLHVFFTTPSSSDHDMIM